MASLPMYVVVKSKYNNKYWAYVEKEGETHGYIKSTGNGKDVLSPLSKFQVERAESDSKAVHLRCCYNNKYLMVRSTLPPDVVAEADKPEEDKSKNSCTLFQPTPYGDDYRFKHVYSGKYLTKITLLDSDPYTDTLCPMNPDPNPDHDLFTVIDWSSLLVLPQYVAFKGDNDRYLASYRDNHNYLRFVLSDVGDTAGMHEVFPGPDGTVRLKSKSFGQFWRRSPNWIWADSDDTSANNKDTLFLPVKIDDKTIALRNLGNNHFCSRLTKDGNESCLNACATSIVKEARLQVTELVLSREIYNVQFHPARARIYNEHVEVMGTGQAANTTDKENTMSVTVEHTETKSSSWSASVSLTLGVTTTFETKVPFIAEGKIEISAQVSSEYQWGETHEETNTISSGYETIVPPMTKATVSAVGTVATCDIPFSYTQTDKLMDGTERTYDKDDGMYTGVNSYNVTYQVKNDKI